jgi:hypothetical protein
VPASPPCEVAEAAIESALFDDVVVISDPKPKFWARRAVLISRPNRGCRSSARTPTRLDRSRVSTFFRREMKD